MNRKLTTSKAFHKQGLTPIRETEVYTVTDNNYLKNLTTSETILHPQKCTSGHSHDGLDEVYIFTKGVGTIQIDEEFIEVKAGSVIHVNGGEFHKVYNNSDKDLTFIAIFQKYTREEDSK